MREFFETATPVWIMLVRLMLAAVFGGVVGWDREMRGRSAGLRTHMLVSLGSAGFALIATEFTARLTPPGGPVSGDSLHIIAAVVGGVGFLGAGAIIQSGGTVKGLTTAAGLWLVAAVGVACGTGMYALAIGLTVMAAMTLSLMRYVEAHARGTSSKRAD